MEKEPTNDFCFYDDMFKGVYDFCEKEFIKPTENHNVYKELYNHGIATFNFTKTTNGKIHWCFENNFGDVYKLNLPYSKFDINIFDKIASFLKTQQKVNDKIMTDMTQDKILEEYKDNSMTCNVLDWLITVNTYSKCNYFNKKLISEKYIEKRNIYVDMINKNVDIVEFHIQKRYGTKDDDVTGLRFCRYIASLLSIKFRLNECNTFSMTNSPFLRKLGQPCVSIEDFVSFFDEKIKSWTEKSIGHFDRHFLDFKRAYVNMMKNMTYGISLFKYSFLDDSMVKLGLDYEITVSNINSFYSIGTNVCLFTDNELKNIDTTLCPCNRHNYK